MRAHTCLSTRRRMQTSLSTRMSPHACLSTRAQTHTKSASLLHVNLFEHRLEVDHVKVLELTEKLLVAIIIAQFIHNLGRRLLNCSLLFSGGAALLCCFFSYPSTPKIALNPKS